jgi:hypothetical protein
MKDEASRIVGYKFMCAEYLLILELEEAGDALMKVTISTQKEVQNISRHTENLAVTLQLDDWGHLEHKSEILECYYKVGDGARVDAMKSVSGPDMIGREATVAVGPGMLVKTVSKGREYKLRNSDIIMGMTYPITRPRIQIKHPQGYQCYCTSLLADEKMIRSEISEEYQLEGTIFPGQHIRVRWWPKV